MQPISYNVAKAKELLKEAGYPNGFESTLWSGYNNTTSQKVIQFIQQQLQQVGIKVSVEALEPGKRVELVDSWPDPKTAKARLYYIGWSSSTGEADWALRPLFSTESWSPKLANYAFYSNPVVDESIAKALLTTNGAERAALYKTAQEQLAKDLPRIPLVTEDVLYAHSKRLSGVYVMPDGNINSDEIALK
jgi:glutathione transport system substrate-binding protein